MLWLGATLQHEANGKRTKLLEGLRSVARDSFASGESNTDLLGRRLSVPPFSQAP